MTSRIINTEAERDGLVLLIKAQKLPFTIQVTKGRRRSVEQNRLQRMWVAEISEQIGEYTPEEVRAYCKLTMGVPILRAENDDFREKYDKHVRGLAYEVKLALMSEPLDMPVTRMMTTDQKRRYLDAVHKHFAAQGVDLTDPDRIAA